MTQKQWKMVEAVEAASICNVLKCRLKVRSAQKVTTKVTEKSAGFSWTESSFTIAVTSN